MRPPRRYAPRGLSRNACLGRKSRQHGSPREGPEPVRKQAFRCEPEIGFTAQSTHSSEPICTVAKVGKRVELRIEFTRLDHDLARKLRQYLIDWKSDGISAPPHGDHRSPPPNISAHWSRNARSDSPAPRATCNVPAGDVEVRHRRLDRGALTRGPTGMCPRSGASIRAASRRASAYGMS